MNWVERWKKALESEDLWLSGELVPNIDFLEYDSRKLDQREGQGVFFARPGHRADGHDFVPSLLGHPKLSQFVLEKNLEEVADAQKILVRSSNRAMALAAKYFYGNPSEELFCAAVTGTNGKSTSVALLKQLLEYQSIPTASVGTVETGFQDFRPHNPLTSPDFTELQSWMAEFVKKGAQSIAFEASSHAVHQGRLDGVECDAALFTNLSPEHLDYHGTMENYFAAKKALFTEVLAKSNKARKIAVVPEDGKYGSALIEELKNFSQIELWTWSFSKHQKTNHQLSVDLLEMDMEGARFVIDTKEGERFELHSPLLGKHNVENLMTALTLMKARGLLNQSLVEKIKSVKPPAGRLEPVLAKDLRVLIDYAHSPDALENVLQCLRSLCHAQIHVVFGCGGERDKQKRPKMGEVAELYADQIYITSDNPRGEKPSDIIMEIESGLQKTKRFQKIEDRREAIYEAIKKAQPGDVVLIAGKGHETHQEVAGQFIPFDDKKVAEEGVSKR